MLGVELICFKRSVDLQLLLFELQLVCLGSGVDGKLLLFELQLLGLDLQLLLLHLHNRVLLHLLGLLLGGFGLVRGKYLLSGLGHHGRQRQLHLWRQFLALGWEGHAHLLLDALAVGVGGVLSDVGHHGGHHGLGLWVLADQLHHLGVLGRGHVHLNVGGVVLVLERLDRLHVQDVHVLADGVAGLHVVVDGHELVSVLDAQHLDHLAVQLGQVINLRGLGGQLDHSLVLHDPLGHRGAVGVRHGDHVHHVVVLLERHAAAGDGLERIRIWGVVADDALEELELLLHRVVHTRLHGRHGLELALQQGQRGTHRSIRTHIADLHVGDRAQTAGLHGDFLQQPGQHLAWLFVGQGHDVVTHGATGHVHVAELTRSDRGVVAFDPQPTGLQTAGQVGERARVHQLTDDRRASPGVAPDQVDVADAVRAKPCDVVVLYEVIALCVRLGALFPVTVDGQHLVCATVDGDDVGQGQTVFVLKPGQVIFNLRLKQLVAVVFSQGIPLIFGLFLLNVGEERHRLPQVHVAVEATDLQALQVVLALAQHMGRALCVTHAAAAPRQDHIFCRDKHGHLTVLASVEVDLFERATGQAQIEQHAFVLGAVLRHLLGQAPVHVVAHALRSFFLESVDRTHDLCLDWASGRERLNNRFALEANGGFGQQGAEHTTSSIPRFRTFFIPHPQNFQALDVGLYPVFA